MMELRKSASYSGYDDEIYDISHANINGVDFIAAASNTNELRIYNLDTNDCSSIKGHTDSILTVCFAPWTPNLLATGSKDNTIRLWWMDPKHLETTHSIAEATGHTNSVSSLRFSHLSTKRKSSTKPFLISVSADTTVKAWSMEAYEKVFGVVGEDKKAEIPKLSTSTTIVAHSKEINSVDVSRNDKLCVTASMDKTAELFHIDRETLGLTSAGTLSGHKRGVWCARFSPNEQLVATAGGDCSIRIYSLTDMSCTQVLQDHSFAVLSLLFTNSSNSLLSVDGGGLIKVWKLASAKASSNSVCLSTVEAHEDKIWTLEAISQNDGGCRYATAGADGHLSVWQDVGEEVKVENERERLKLVVQQQSLENLKSQGRWVEAMQMALDLDQPYNCLTILESIISSGEASNRQLDQLICQLTPVQLSALLDYAAKWNVNTKTYSIAQQVLNHTLHSLSPDALMKLPNIADIVKAFLPYTQKHYDRLEQMRTNTSHVKYVFSRMRKLD